MEWEKVIKNPLLHNLPFKIEMNRFGQILMSPSSNQHGRIQLDIGHGLKRRRKNGSLMTAAQLKFPMASRSRMLLGRPMNLSPSLAFKRLTHKRRRFVSKWFHHLILKHP